MINGAFSERFPIYTVPMEPTLNIHESYTEISFPEPPCVDTLVKINDLRATHYNVLINLSGGIAIDIMHLHDLIVMLNDRPIQPDAATAIYAEDNLAYSLGKVFEEHRSELGYRVKVFRDRDLAIDWINNLEPAICNKS